MIDDARRADPVGLIAGAVLTLATHVGLVVLLLLVNAFGEAEALEPTIVLPVLSTELLMLGDVLPEDGQLPWISNPEPGPLVEPEQATEVALDQETTLPEPEVVVIDPSDTVADRVEENRPRPEEHRPDRAERSSRGETNPNRPTNNEPRIGSPDGVAGGTSLSATARANQLAAITAQLSLALLRPQAIPESEYSSLTARINVRVTEAGRITSWEFVESSGNQLFDDAAERMLSSFRMGRSRLRLSTVTNEALRRSIIDRGFTVPIRAR